MTPRGDDFRFWSAQSGVSLMRMISCNFKRPTRLQQFSATALHRAEQLSDDVIAAIERVF
jgi:hypothetical protein